MCCSLGHECGCRGKKAPLDYKCHLCDEMLVKDGDRLLGMCSPCFKSVTSDFVTLTQEMEELHPIKGCECGCGGDKLVDTNADL